MGTLLVTLLVTLLGLGALIWSLARPSWIERAPASAVRRLPSVAGVSMIGAGVSLLTPAVGTGLPIVWAVAMLAIAVGVGLLHGAGRLAAAGR